MTPNPRATSTWFGLVPSTTPGGSVEAKLGDGSGSSFWALKNETWSAEDFKLLQKRNPHGVHTGKTLPHEHAKSTLTHFPQTQRTDLHAHIAFIHRIMDTCDNVRKNYFFANPGGFFSQPAGPIRAVDPPRVC